MYAFLSKGDLIEMNNKKLSRLLEPNLKLYFLCMIVFAAATATVSLPLGLVEIACTVGLYAYFTNRNQKRRQNILQYIDNVTGSVDTASKSTLINSPLPIMVFRPDTGEVIWSNENFLQLAGVREHLFEMKVEDARSWATRWAFCRRPPAWRTGRIHGCSFSAASSCRRSRSPARRASSSMPTGC